MKEPASDDLLRILIDDLSEYPETWVIRAIHEHRKASPFWPALADLVKHMQPSIDAEKQRRAFKRRQEESRAFVQGTGHKSKLSEEERKAFVIAELGYNPNGLHRMSKKAWADECDAQGLTLEQVETMPAEDVCKAFMKHDKPWHDPKHLKASARRLAVYMDKQDPDWRNAS